MTANQNPEISKWFTQFSEPGRDSAIYHFLSLKIADDAELLASIRNYTPPNTTQPVPNLFFAAILFISSRDRDRGRTDLSQYFPTLGGKTDLTRKFYETFRQFAINREREIGMIVQKRFVQTNEVRRSCILLPAVGGASIGRRIGIDLNPIDLRSGDERLWATSLIWPDQLERFERLAGAICMMSDPLWPAQDATSEIMEAHRSAEKLANTFYILGISTFVAGVGAFLSTLIFGKKKGGSK